MGLAQETRSGYFISPFADKAILLPDDSVNSE